MGYKAWYAIVGAFALCSCATTDPSSSPNPTGIVQGIYVEQFPGVLVDRAVAGAPAGRPTWAWVRFDQAQDGRAYAAARVQEGTAIETGDLVRMQLAGLPEALHRLSPENRIVAVLSSSHPLAGLIVPRPPASRSRVPVQQAER
jgi:hypothetical protein